LNGRAVSFSFKATEPTPINPATRYVLVSLPPGVQQGKIQIDIEYGGRLKDLPEFGTFPDQERALDDQINSRLVELANYSSWYPQFFVMGHPLEIKLQVSLPEGWVAICSGKKLEQRVKDGRSITRWSSPTDTDILIAASPNYKEKSTRLSVSYDLMVRVDPATGNLKVRGKMETLQRAAKPTSSNSKKARYTKSSCGTYVPN
jgi:hypothetical protein